jgi:lipopolysaccharide/colanic/teichoic acid biosynthesis glycosyltransferase
VIGSRSGVKGLTRIQAVSKRSVDLLIAIVGLSLTFWLIALAWVVATIDTRASGFFAQTRIGRNGRDFRLFKLRTMRENLLMNTTVTTAADERITTVGRVLRRLKLDELPQLLNVLRGDMSIVGPRPDVPGFADALVGDDRIILSVRPGITGPATLKYRDEETLLENVHDPERYNREVIYPDKVRINREYVENYSFWADIRYLRETVLPSNKSKSQENP